MRKLKQRLFSLLLCAALAVSLCVPAAAVDTGKYLTWDDAQKKLVEANIPGSITEVKDETTELKDTTTSRGWYIVRNSVEISSRVTVTGDVHLILADKCALKADGGIEINSQGSNSLTIYAQSDNENMGALTATGGTREAGIQCGTGQVLTINGGSVIAAGGSYGAGIGGYYEKAGGSINILGGTVAASSQLGAGIGGGWQGTGGNITISGGMVTATSQSYGAGIGGGQHGSGGKITITGGEVTATGGGGDGGAGIGGGAFRDGGEITITGGTVEASSGKGAGIGGGWGGDAGGAGGEITITGGMVEATSTNGAGIGGGAGGGAGGAGGTITIEGGVVTAASINDGAGIGGGAGNGAGGAGGEITISGGVVKAIGNTDGAGIGGGMGVGGGAGGGGNFIADGNAFIVASSIKDNGTEKKKQWSGVIFEGDSGKVYGSPTLAADAEIPAKRTLEIEAGKILTIGKNATLTNNGTITGSGTIKGKVINNGTIEDGITVQDHSHQWDTAWSSDATNHWHRCTVTGCGERSETAAHTPGDWVIDKAATSTEAGQRHKECTVCGYTTQTETIPATGGGDGGGDGGSGGGGSYTPPTYKPDVPQPGEGGGTPSISPSKPEKGDTVTVTPKPDGGYEVDEIIVTDKNGKPVEVTRKPDGTYTFTQPGSKVTIEVTYRPVQPVETPWKNPFSDVFESDWYYEAVRFVQERGLMTGYEDGRFGPGDILSRAQLAQILFNKEGKPVVNYLMDFADIAGEAWYAEAVRWAASQGIVGGYGNGTFGPDDPITREQLAVMFWRYSGSPAAAGKELQFSDESEISPFAREALLWAVENGILNGCGDGRLGPQWQVTRAQVAQMLKNFIENQEENT